MAERRFPACSSPSPAGGDASAGQFRCVGNDDPIGLNVELSIRVSAERNLYRLLAVLPSDGRPVDAMLPRAPVKWALSQISNQPEF